MTKTTPVIVHNSHRWDLRYRVPGGEVIVPAAVRGDGAMIGRPGTADLSREQYEQVKKRLDAHAANSNGAILVVGA